MVHIDIILLLFGPQNRSDFVQQVGLTGSQGACRVLLQEQLRDTNDRLVKIRENLAAKSHDAAIMSDKVGDLVEPRDLLLG